ncbi:hypothetical protein NPIL_400611 [Nephila pilipes]|uniref:Uncharacterized protein n=1 Tax=Nephila pilipes TaxID=299642 RepID=A0A8X6NFK1_NEPPI|nr:hypothetical protein NPIL_400611 [Nephila pilipes]
MTGSMVYSVLRSLNQRLLILLWTDISARLGQLPSLVHAVSSTRIIYTYISLKLDLVEWLLPAEYLWSRVCFASLIFIPMRVSLFESWGNRAVGPAEDD